MSDLPDLDTIATMLTAVEARDPNATTTSRFDEDHNVLRSTQAEIVEMLARELPAEVQQGRSTRIVGSNRQRHRPQPGTARRSTIAGSRRLTQGNPGRARPTRVRDLPR